MIHRVPSKKIHKFLVEVGLAPTLISGEGLGQAQGLPAIVRVTYNNTNANQIQEGIAMPVPEIIHQLVDQFSANREAYRSGRYNEAQLRQEFLNPFFEALGWDMTNRSNYAPQNREVIHEDSIEIEGGSRAPDYCFRLGQTRKFFVEAKKPAVDIKYDIHPAYQLRRYAWNTHLPLSILTDFEEFAVYDCRNKPNPSDSAATARVLFIKYTQYVEKWDEIAAIFSRDAVWKGSFDKYAADTSPEKGTTEVDDAFLEDIESWRTLLARNIALRNPQVTNERQLNFSVQMTIDRIIFLRICEDRGIEAENQLLEMSKGHEIYARMVELFQRADLKYNSGLFHFKAEKGESNHADLFTPSLAIDDRVLKEIIKSLYYPCPYIFKEIPVEILGQVYEQFLGKVIRLTPGRQVKIKEKPEVRKAGGVYYTPSYIVAYIVANTVGKLLEDKTPDAASLLKIVDPACGSGSFLLGAFQYLLDWHEKWYLAHDPAKWVKGKKPALIPQEGGSWKLTTAEKKRILVNNIYGVDIDAQAVEVTKLSLLLKVLEEETGQLSLGLERVLPDLGENIKCGNSLIGWDYFEGQLVINENEKERVNPFDWQKAFPQVFTRGGFDAVIGNPPYGAEFPGHTIEYLKNEYFTYVWRGESYLLFVERSIRLLKDQGMFGYIIPDTYLNLGFTKVLRDFLLQKSQLKEIVVLPRLVFSGVSVDTTLIFSKKHELFEGINSSDVHVRVFDKKVMISNLLQPSKIFEVSTNIWHKYDSFLVQSNMNEINLISKIEETETTLLNLSEIFYGIKVYQVGKGKPPQTKLILDSKPFTSNNQENENFFPFFDGKDIGRYKLLWLRNNWLQYGKWLAEPRVPEKFEGEKLLIRKIVGRTLIATYIPETSYCNTLLYVLRISNINIFGYKYLLGVLNSKMMGWYYRHKFQINSTDTFPQILIRDLLQFRIAIPNKNNHNHMVALVERMLELHKRTPQTPHEKDRLQREIAATDAAIDRLVYELYELTEEEIRVVEGG